MRDPLPGCVPSNAETRQLGDPTVATVRDYPKLGRDIINLVGGEKNIAQATRCATRLRLVLSSTPPDAKAKIDALPGVITVVESGGQFQVVIGTHVGEVYDAVAQELKLENGADAGAGPKMSIVSRVIATMSAVFAPFVYILAAAGLLQGALIVISMVWPGFTETGSYEVFSFMSWTPFTFLPILIAITASQYFKTNMLVAVLCCAAIMNPTWNEMAARISSGETITLFGIALSPTTYTSSVLPPLFLVWLLSYLERFLNKHLTGVGRSILVPLICLVVLVPLTLLSIGPVTSATAVGIATGYNWLSADLPILAGALIGGFWQLAVVFGIHWGITPVVLANFEQYQSDSFQAFQTAAVIAQVGAVAGVFFKTRNRELKRVAGSAAIPGLFGITEPAIYGVTLRLKKPFLLACVAGAAGAIVIALFGSRYYAYAGLPGPLTIVNAYQPGTTSLLGEIIGCLVAFFGAMVLVFVFGFKDPVVELDAEIHEPGTPLSSTVLTEDAYAEMVAAAGSSTRITSPVTGKVVPMSEVPDPVFSTGIMGAGVAIAPTDSRIYAPFDGTVVVVMPSKHALGLISDDGVELLIHVGIDTVKLNGEHFTVHTHINAKVKKGDLLLEFDHAAITRAGYSLLTPVIVTNSQDFDDVLPYPRTEVTHGEELATAVKATVSIAE
ncbi:MAG: PTS glucose transporter subunit IIA [Candidatus Saccharibacteria bacterium]|nr:PTS glucose transporter subunit IIA [Microbacteriaceae bacterium]